MRNRKDITSETSLQIDLGMVEKLEKKGHESAAIIAAIYTLHRSKMPIDNEQMILNELENGSQSIEKECTVCYDNDINCVLVPCGHAILCIDCANTLPNGICSYCETPVERVLKIYHK